MGKSFLRKTVKIFAAFSLIILIALLLLPTTLSRYMGSHTWISSPNCVVCHVDIVEELNKTKSSIWPHYYFTEINQTQCKECHQFGHNVTLTECMNCHSGTNQSKSLNNSIHSQLTRSEGCMACHTDVKVNFTWRG
ncbi:MAG: cytochrome c3 family protein [Candidatus Hydrothermarchaeota archaeon]